MADEEPNFLEKIKEKYLFFTEGLREKGVPMPHLIVPLAIILILAVAAFFTVPGLYVEKKDVSLTIKNTLGNPLSGALVEVVVNNQTLDSKHADSSGKVSLQGVPSNAQIRISAEGFTTKTKNVLDLSSASTGTTISLQSLAPPVKQVTIRVIDSNNQPVLGAFVQVSFATGDFAPQATTDAAGNALVSIEESKLAQGTITINAVGFETTQNPVTQGELEGDAPIVITILPQHTSSSASGDFTVRVTAAATANRGVERAVVTLIDVVTDEEKFSERTSVDGSVRFQNVSYGKAFTVRITHPQFNDATQEFTPSASNHELAVQLNARSSPASTLSLSVVNQDHLPLSAEVRLFQSTSNSLVEKGQTDSSGEFTTTVAQNANLYATVYADGYLPTFVSDLTAGAVKSVQLQQILPGNSVPITIVVKEDGFPASNAEVSLYRSGGFFLGIPTLTAGGEGMVNATIPREVSGAYKVYARASKEASSGQSDLVDVTTTPISLSVDLLATPANVSINLKDLSTGQSIPNGAIEALVQGLPVSSCTIQNASCVLPVAANKEFTIQATSAGYLTYTTSTKQYAPGEKANLTISLFPISLAQGATVTFLGLFDSRNAKVREVQNAETYTAKFAANMPQNIENAGFYLQAGQEETSESSLATITSFDSNGAPFVQSDSQLQLSTSGSNQTCYSGQSTPNTDKKWVYFSFPRGFTGTKEFAVSIKVSKTGQPGANVELLYKAFGFKDGLPLLYPSDTQLLETLRQKIDEGAKIGPEDTCQMRTVTQTVPVTQQTLTCSDQEDLCWKLTLSDSSAVGTPSTFQPQVAKDFTLDLEVLSALSIDSLALSTSHFNVKNSQQTLTSATSLSFADDATVTSSGAVNEEKKFNLPFTALPNKKAKMTMTLTPLKVSQSAPLIFTLRNGDKTLQIPATLSISGTNAFTVTTAPQQIPALEPGKVTVVVRDKASRPVEDASISLFECAGAPSSGNEPSQTLGDGTLNNGQNGRYRIDSQPTGLGEIGVRVEAPDFKTYESCAVTVIAKNFLTLDPDTLEFTGSSLDPQAQQITLTNALNEPVRISTSVNCGGDQVPVKIFPTSTTIEPNTDATISVKLLDNVTSTAQCLASFNARIGTYKNVEELPISVNVNCPGCQLNVATGSDLAPLPPGLTLVPAAPFFQDVATIPLRLSADPTCSLDGLRINYAGIYAANTPVQTYQNGVLAGTPTPVLFACEACSQPDSNRNSECNQCQQVRQSQWSCGACSPHPVTTPTSSQLPIFESATCSLCQQSYGAYQSAAFMSPLDYNRNQLPYNPAFQTQRVGFDPTVNSVYREDFGYGNDMYGQRFGVRPALPGSPYFPQSNGYNLGQGRFSSDSLREALQVQECTKDGITIAADYQFLRQVVPGSGNLQVTLPDGTRKTVRVSVLPNQMGPVSQNGPIPFNSASWEQACGIDTSVNVKLDQNYKFKEKVTVNFKCPIQFSTTKIEYVHTKDNEDLAKSSCTEKLSGSEVTLDCDFAKDDEAKAALDKDGAVYVRVTAIAASNLNAKVTVDVKATFKKATTSLASPLTGASDTSTPAVDDTAAAPDETPVPSDPVKLSLFRKGDTKTNLCGKDVEKGADLQISYSFIPSDESTKRLVIVKKGTGATTTEDTRFDASKLTAPKGKLDYKLAETVGEQRSFQASTEYRSSPQFSNDCTITIVDQKPLITNIKPVFLSNSAKFKEWEDGQQFPYKTYTDSAIMDLDAAALKQRTGSKDVSVEVQYVCVDGNKNIFKHTYSLPASTNYAVTDAILKTNAIQSLDLTKCKPKVDSEIKYKIHVTIKQGTTLIEDKWYGPNKAAVVEAAASTVSVLNYPEAPFINTPPMVSALPDDLTKATFDGCGRLDAPEISMIYLFKILDASSGKYTILKSDDAISSGETFHARFCTPKVADKYKTMQFFVEYTDKNGAVKLELIENAGCILTSSSGTPTIVGCESQFSTDSFLSPTAIKEKKIDTDKSISFKARMLNSGTTATAGAFATERYYCKYWPKLSGDALCDFDKVKYNIKESQHFYKNDPTTHCILPEYPNPNWLLCDLQEGEEVVLPTLQKLKIDNIDATEIQFTGTHANGDTMDCDPIAMPGNYQGEFKRPDEIGLGKRTAKCNDGGLISLNGDHTDFFTVHVDEMVTGPRFGETTDSPNAVGRFRIFTVFGPADGWLESDYHYNFDIYGKSGQRLKLVSYLDAPKVALSTLGTQFSGVEPKQGVYIMGVNDVAKIRSGSQTAIIRYVGYAGIKSISLPGVGSLINRDQPDLFEVRSSDKGIIQDCQINTAAGYVDAVSLSGFAAGLVCFAPGTNIIACPVLVGLVGVAAVATFNPNIPDRTLLRANLDEAVACDSGTISPDPVVRVLKTGEETLSDGTKSPKVCVIISTDEGTDDTWRDRHNQVAALSVKSEVVCNP